MFESECELRRGESVGNETIEETEGYYSLEVLFLDYPEDCNGRKSRLEK